MADSIEHKIITAIVARMAAIDGTGSYLTTVANAEDSRQTWDSGDADAGRPSELPAISVFSGKVRSEALDDEGRETVHTMPVMLRGVYPTGDDAADNASTGRKMMADMMRAIRSDDQWIVASVPLANYTGEVSHGIEYDSEDSFEITGVEVEIEVQFTTAKFNLEA